MRKFNKQKEIKNDRDDGIIRQELSNSSSNYVQENKGKHEHNENGTEYFLKNQMERVERKKNLK